MAQVTINWSWMEAFDKFGFGDGDGWNGTDLVQDELENLGYEVECDTIGIHNWAIVRLKRGDFDHEFLGYPLENDDDNPVKVLPADVLKALNDKFGDWKEDYYESV